MATYLNRLEFRVRYPAIRQGLFIFSDGKRLPKEQQEVNLGRFLSNALCRESSESRPGMVIPLAEQAVSDYYAVTLTHVEILFTPDLETDTVRMLLSLCRNKKICIVWPGTIQSGRLIYADPGFPEYYECSPATLQDTYIISD